MVVSKLKTMIASKRMISDPRTLLRCLKEIVYYAAFDGKFSDKAYVVIRLISLMDYI